MAAGIYQGLTVAAQLPSTLAGLASMAESMRLFNEWQQATKPEKYRLSGWATGAGRDQYNLPTFQSRYAVGTGMGYGSAQNAGRVNTGINDFLAGYTQRPTSFDTKMALRT